MERNTKAFDVSQRISVNVSKFRGIMYFHISDKLKQKSVSLKKEDFLQLCKKRDVILDFAKKTVDQKIEQKLPKKKHRSEKHYTHDWDDEEDESKNNSDDSEY